MSTARCDRQAHRRRQLNRRKSGSAEPAPVIDPFHRLPAQARQCPGVWLHFPRSNYLEAI